LPWRRIISTLAGLDIDIYNQYQTCGYRLDFVLYNKNNKKFVALEVDGPHHFEGDGLSNYADCHVERIEKLKRAGWNIINTPYYKWYLKGWLEPSGAFGKVCQAREDTAGL
jgi:very-short-patch-repair endonuclease